MGRKSNSHLILCLITHGKLENKQKKSRGKAALIGYSDTPHMCFEELLCFYSLSYLRYVGYFRRPGANKLIKIYKFLHIHDAIYPSPQIIISISHLGFFFLS